MSSLILERSPKIDISMSLRAKQKPDDIHVQITVANRANESAFIVVLPCLWFRNTWTWGCSHEGCFRKPCIWRDKTGKIRTDHETLDPMYFFYEETEEVLFTENETNFERLYGSKNPSLYVKDAFHDYIVSGKTFVCNRSPRGTKMAPVYRLRLAPAECRILYLRLVSIADWDGKPGADPGLFELRQCETDRFYSQLAEALDEESSKIFRQAAAGLLWSKQFYHYVVKDWLKGDAFEATPPASRWLGRNHDWLQVYSRDVISMPDKWEYPWFAAWDLAFHVLPFAHLDPEFAKQQLELFLREWYMHPNGQIPAYEFAFSDVNPPVHAWAAWRVYKISGTYGSRDTDFLESVFHKLLLNFTWWVNRKDTEGNNIFSGGFLGLDNIGVFDRSRPLPTGGYLQQADLDENEFFSPYGIRSLSKIHATQPYIFRADGQEYRVEYEPGEGNTHLFGGNSNWRGPVWFPINYLIVEALERYHHFYGDDFKVECPTGSGVLKNLREVADELSRRLIRIFLPDSTGNRPCHGDEKIYASDPHWKDLILFYEYFHGDTGRGCGANHQTGWTALVARLIISQARRTSGPS